MELDMGSITNRRNTTSACPSWNHAKVKHKNLKFCYERVHTSVKGENDRPAPTIAGQRVTLDQARSRGVPRTTRDHIRTAAICKAQAQAKPTAQLNEVYLTPGGRPFPRELQWSGRTAPDLPACIEC
ncbi:hypothetical protein HYE67_006208 [Fusarium culmorum]|uniref:Uncharacterized protein n=1 Tax=Fusarium culmorum TaxID=5516 RepID=A0A2T4GEJ3_FUSCU|nr:hypothetical protein FCULG_00009999 [Fusarium culmorum]QPC63977.1 hypothetical protein HYE67_006208 [Fusarium culmorum]